MASFRVNPATVSTDGLRLRDAPSLNSTKIGLLNAGDVVESTGEPQSQPPIVWLPVRVVSSASVAPGTTGFAALSQDGVTFLVPAGDGPRSPLLAATARVADIMQLPPLLLKAFMGVEGANVNHRDGVLQVTPGTRPGVISRLSRANKLAALDLPADTTISDADLNTRFAQAFEAKNLTVQIMTGAQYIKEQLDRFNGYVALAGLAYNAGPGGAQRVIGNFGGDPLHTALQYHKHIGTGANQVTVQPGIEQIDPATGTRWIRFPVIANDSGKEIFQYLYLRQVPKRNHGLLDFIYRPALLESRGLYENDTPPAADTGGQALAVVNGQFKTVSTGEQGNQMFSTQPLSQRDQQWKSIVLGFGDAATTIGSDGCTLTCLTMVANGFGFQETPASLNDKLKALGAGRGYLGALMVWSGLPAALPGMQLNNFVRCRDVPAPMGDIDATLDAGKPVVIELDMSPSAGLQNHWVVLYGRQGSDYLMLDPWPVPAEPGTSLVQRYGFTGAPAQIITSVVFYDSPNGRRAAPVGGTLRVIVNDTPEMRAAGGLALRDAPVSGTIKMRLPAGTPLEVTEGGEAAAKIGVNLEWLAVRTAEGATGFVAAWLVQAAPAGLLPVEKELEAFEPVTDKALIGSTQPPLRPALVVVVKRLGKSTKVTKGTKKKVKKVGMAAVNPPSVVLRAKAPRGKIIVTLRPGAKLTVQEPAEGALDKIGRRGQWLNVRDARGRVGFVSAGFVRLP